MIGEAITWSLILVLGYAYPAFQCFKTIEKNRVEIPELRFWCQYWIIIAVITCLEKTGDVFISWLPMYGEMKLAIFIYLWYPRARGTEFIYDNLLRPYVSKHELDIESSLVTFRDRAWDLAIYFWHNCTELGSEKIIQILQFLASQGRNTQLNSQNRQNQPPPSAPPMPPPSAPPGPPRAPPGPPRAPPSSPFTFFRGSGRQQPAGPSSPSSHHRQGPPSTSHYSQAPYTTSRHSQSPKSETILVHLDNKTHYVRPEDVVLPHSDNRNGVDPNGGIEEDVQAARLRLRRFIGGK